MSCRTRYLFSDSLWTMVWCCVWLGDVCTGSRSFAHCCERSQHRTKNLTGAQQVAPLAELHFWHRVVAIQLHQVSSSNTEREAESADWQQRCKALKGKLHGNSHTLMLAERSGRPPASGAVQQHGEASRGAGRMAGAVRGLGRAAAVATGLQCWT